MNDFAFQLPTAVVPAAVIAILSLLWWSVRPDAIAAGGKFVVGYGRPMRALVGFFWVCWVVFLFAAILTPTQDRAIAAVVTASFLLMTVTLHLEFFIARIEFDGDGIRTRSPWRAGRQIPWSAISRVDFSPSLQWYVVRTKGFGAIRLPTFLSGLRTLLGEIESRGIGVAGPP